jgi:DNA-binding transcriptional LysR family regulator
MDLAALQIFHAVVTEGGIARAARKLHRVQSNVTTRVKQLEQSLGVELFVRAGKRLTLSPAGKRLLEYAEPMLRLAVEARDAVRSDEPAGMLRLGSMESTAASRLPAILAAYHRRHPTVYLQLTTCPSFDLMQSLLAGELDAVFVADPAPSPEVQTLHVFDERLVIVAGADQPPVRCADDVGDRTLLAFRTGCAYRKRLENWFAASGTAPQRVLELGSYHAMLACAAAGTGIAIVPESVIELVPRLRGVTIHALPARVAHVKTLLAWRRGHESPALRALIEILRDVSSAPRKRASTN